VSSRRANDTGQRPFEKTQHIIAKKEKKNKKRTTKKYNYDKRGGKLETERTRV